VDCQVHITYFFQLCMVHLQFCNNFFTVLKQQNTLKKSSNEHLAWKQNISFLFHIILMRSVE